MPPKRRVVGARSELGVDCATGEDVATSEMAAISAAALTRRRIRTAVFIRIDEGVHQDAVFECLPAIGLTVAVGIDLHFNHLVVVVVLPTIDLSVALG